MAARKLTSRFGDGNSSVGGSWDRGPFGAATSGFSPGPRFCCFRRHHTSNSRRQTLQKHPHGNNLETDVNLHYTHYHIWGWNQKTPKEENKKTKPATGPHHKKDTNGTRIHTKRSTIYRVRAARYRNNNRQKQNNDGRTIEKEWKPTPEWNNKKHYTRRMERTSQNDKRKIWHHWGRPGKEWIHDQEKHQ